MSQVFSIPAGQEPEPRPARVEILVPALPPDSPWRAAGAAVEGVSHRKHGLPCQDSQAYRLVKTADGPALLVALADGAGSAVRADMGAMFAVEASLYSLERGLSDHPSPREHLPALLLEAFESARTLLVALSEEDAIPLRELSTTLVCVVALEDRLAAAHLGDGSVVIQNSQGELEAVTRPQRGEYANETYFLTQEDALEQVQVEVVDGAVQALAVMSDGLIRLAMQMPANRPHAPFFTPLFAFIAAAQDSQAASQQLASFLNSERVCSRTDDDKSLVLAVRRTDRGTGAEPAAAQPGIHEPSGEVQLPGSGQDASDKDPTLERKKK